MRSLFLSLGLILLLVLPSLVTAHEMRPAYLQIRELAPGTYDVIWKVPAKGDAERLVLDPRYAADVEILTEPVGGFMAGAYVERTQIRREGGLAGTEVTIEGLERTFTDVLLRLEYLSGAEITHRLTPEAPTYVVEDQPSMAKVARTYFALGVEHILQGIDHLLFVLALLLVVGSWRKLIGTITAFTIAHSITLALASLGLVRVPGAPVEAVIALSIVFVSAEIIHGREGRPGLTARWPWVVSFTFGLLHGFGFAGALSEIGLPQSSIPLALLTFNIGVEAGQLLFVAAMVLLYSVGRRFTVPTPVWAWKVPPYAIGGVAAFWMIERVVGFWQ